MKSLCSHQKSQFKVFILLEALILEEVNEEIDVKSFSKIDSENIEGNIVYKDDEYD